MLNKVKHPRVGILRFAQNNQTLHNPEEPSFIRQDWGLKTRQSPISRKAGVDGSRTHRRLLGATGHQF